MHHFIRAYRVFRRLMRKLPSGKSFLVVDDRGARHCRHLALPRCSRWYLSQRSKIEGTPSANIEENVPRITSQWDYRPRKATRAPAVFDSPGAETYEVLSPDPCVINNDVWCNDDSPECAAPAFIRLRPDGEELMTKVLSETTDTVCATPTVDDAAVSTYD